MCSYKSQIFEYNYELGTITIGGIRLHFNKTKTLIIALEFTLILLSGVVSGCSGKKPVSTDDVLTPVTTISVKSEQISMTKTFSGKVNADTEVSVASKVAGRLERVNYDVGDNVRVGDILFSLDKVNVINNISLLESQLKSAKAIINNAEIGLQAAIGSQSQTSITQSETALKSAEINFRDAEKSYNDIKALYSAGAVSKEQYDRTKSVFRQAELAYEATQKTHYLLINKVLDQNISIAQNQLNQAMASEGVLNAQLADARKMLVDMDVVSPINGVVAFSSAKQGELVAAGVPLLIVTDINELFVNISISEKLVNSINVGQKTKIIIKTIGEELFEGIVSSISPVANTETSTYPIKVAIKRKDVGIKPGMYAEVIFEIEKIDNAIIVPRRSIEVDGEERFIFVVDQDIVKRIPIITGIDNGEQIEIKEGLNVGQEIIIRGREYVKDGDKVKIVND